QPPRPETDPGAVRRGRPALLAPGPEGRRPPAPPGLREDARRGRLPGHLLPRASQVRRANAAGRVRLLQTQPVSAMPVGTGLRTRKRESCAFSIRLRQG